MSAPLPTPFRPVPIQEAFQSITSATRFLASLVAIAVGYGLLTALQGDAIGGLIGAVPGLVTLGGDVYRSFRTEQAIKQAEAAVTPLADPAVVVDGQLVALVPATGRHAG